MLPFSVLGYRSTANKQVTLRKDLDSSLVSLRFHFTDIYLVGLELIFRDIPSVLLAGASKKSPVV